MGQGSKYGRIFIRDQSCYQLKIICYIVEIFYVSLIVTTEQKPAGDTQKIKKKESKHQFPRKDRRRERKGQDSTNSQKASIFFFLKTKLGI